MKKVIVLGAGELAIKICDWFHKSNNHILRQIIPAIPEPKWTESLSKWSNKNNMDLIESGNYEDCNIDDIDLVMSVFYNKIIKSSFIKKCSKIINLHNSPLPKYRGMSPINWALKDKQNEHGVTIHGISPGIDDGPIIAQLKYSLYPEFDEVIDVYKRSLLYAFVLFENTMPIIDKITPRPQDENETIYHSKSENSLLNERRYFTKKISLEIQKENKSNNKSG